MSESLILMGGATVAGSDGSLGFLGWIIVEPHNKVATHLAVEPRRHFGHGHLVPIGYVIDTDSIDIRVDLDKTTFDRLDPDVRTETLPTTLPVGNLPNLAKVTLHQIPYGEVEVVVDENIHARGERAAHLSGLVVDAADYRIREILIKSGHFPHRHHVAVSVENVIEIDDYGVYLSLTSDEINALPPRDI